MKKKLDKGTKVCIAIMIIALVSVVVTLIFTNMQNDNYTQTAYQSSINDTYSNVNNNTSYSNVKVTIIDFSSMSKDEIQQWCKENKINAVFTEEYSSTIPKNSFIRQSIQNGNFVYENGQVNVVYSLGKEPTLGEKNALKSAKSYLRSMDFSYTGLFKQLKYEGYKDEECTYAVDNCEADWNEQASKCAKSYINSMSFSRVELLKQLKYEGFTDEQAEYGVKSVGY